MENVNGDIKESDKLINTLEKKFKSVIDWFS